MGLSAAEQYGIELVNRARLDPVAEAKRYGISLNEGLPAGTIGAAQKQVLSPNQALQISAEKHSAWMFSKDIFSHTGINGTDPGERMARAGYGPMNSFAWGENLAFQPGMSGAAAVAAEHRLLMLSEGHRETIMRGHYTEIGYGNLNGSYNGNSGSMVTENFATKGGIFLTGVAYSDRNDNNFYNVGEGQKDVRFAEAGGNDRLTAGAGGYGMQVGRDDSMTINIASNGAVGSVRLIDVKVNVKLDLVDRDTIFVSISADLVSGIKNARLLGINNTSLSGTDSANMLIGNKGRNSLDGEGGNDRLVGGAGADRFEFHASGDHDRIGDFSKGQGDRLAIDSKLFGADMSPQDVVRQYAKVIQGNVVFDFGSDTLTLVGVNSTSGLADLITIL